MRSCSKYALPRNSQALSFTTMKCIAQIQFVEPPSRACAGEVTLTGRVLPIGGVKEKTLAARRSGVSTLIFPAGNRKDWAELAGACAPDGCTMP